MSDALSDLKMEADQTTIAEEAEEQDKFCSCCLSTENLTDMFEMVENDGVFECYYDVLHRCYNSQLLNATKNMIKHHICEECIRRLQDSQTLKRQIIEAQRFFLDFFRVQGIGSSSGFKIKDVTAFVETFLQASALEIKADDSDSALEHNFQDADDFSDYKPAPQSSKLTKKRNRLKQSALITKTSKSHARRLVRKSQKKTKEMKIATAEVIKPKGPTMYSSMDMENMTCLVCLKKFQSNHLLRHHMNEHFINHTCEKCGKGFATTSRYSQHMRRHMTGLFKCRLCEKTFDTASKLDNHRASHRVCKYMCQHCNRRFKSFYTRQKHMLVEHAESAGYACHLCPKVCVTSSLLSAHMRKKHEERIRTHGCSVCEKEFYDGSTLLNHMVIHAGTRNFSCIECGKTYARKKTLIQHMKIHRNIRDHVCVHCGQAFIQKCSLKFHMRKHEKLDSSCMQYAIKN